jgi:hypothetical protein
VGVEGRGIDYRVIKQPEYNKDFYKDNEEYWFIN